MENTQKTFTIEIHTTNTDITKDEIKNFIETSIANSKYSKDLTYTIDENVKVLFNFLEDNMVFSSFIRKTKEEFLERYPYFAEEYDFCLSEFNKNKEELLLEFLESTSTKELTEPYYLTPQDFSFCVGEYIKNNMTLEEQKDFLKLATSKGFKVEVY